MRGNVEKLGHRFDARPLLFRRAFPGIGDVLAHAHMGKQTRILEHQANAAPVWWQAIKALAAQPDRATVRAPQPGKDRQKRGFSAA